ncbi:hypothetical protein QQF64_013558 [Cirrhinus molitorella]|uniref:Uncharacterized protein n=1 Tax=Cirrhinus molitorella TaxID=172907 RepID=A0ABR3LRI5_9TELE
MGSRPFEVLFMVAVEGSKWALHPIYWLYGDIELCGRVVLRCGVLVVKDPPGGLRLQVPGILGTNVLGLCYQELFGQHGPALFGFPPVSSAPRPVFQAISHQSAISCRKYDEGKGAWSSGMPYYWWVLDTLVKVHVVSLPTGVTEVRPSIASAYSEATQAVSSTVLEQIAAVDLTALPGSEQDDVPVQQRHRRVPPSEYEVVRAYIKQLLESQVIRESCSPYTSPIILVKKKDGAEASGQAISWPSCAVVGFKHGVQCVHIRFDLLCVRVRGVSCALGAQENLPLSEYQSGEAATPMNLIPFVPGSGVHESRGKGQTHF